MHEGYLDTLAEELESRGLPTGAVLGSLPPSPSADYIAVALKRAVELSGDTGLPLAYGFRLNLASHGILGYALMSARNGDQLLNLLCRYATLAVPGLVLRRVVKGDALLTVCEATGGGILPTESVTELVLASLVSGAGALFNRRIPGAQIWLRFPEPPHVDRYRAFRVPTHFSKEVSALVCDRSFLAMPLSCSLEASGK